MKLIDCTLRDGGYYCNWNFSQKMVGDYLTAMKAINVDYVEMGFRSLETVGFRGVCAYTTDSFLESLSPSINELKLAVMLNAKELVTYKSGPEDACKRLFRPSADSPVSLVRIACHASALAEIAPVCRWLSQSGYKVAVNLMQISEFSNQELDNFALIGENLPIDVLYIADSFGSLDSEKVLDIVQVMRQNYTGSLGIHAHDSTGKAFSNTLAALDAGIEWLDGTLMGMGRGPGNAKTESLVIELNNRRGEKSNLIPLAKCIRNHIQPMHVRYNWGSNMFYHLASCKGIHPTYIQEMLVDERYQEADIFSAIENLSIEKAKSFSIANLEESRQLPAGEINGTWTPAADLNGRELMIIGSGPGAVEHRDGIERYIRKYEPVVIVLNTLSHIDEKLINFRAVCHPIRLLSDYEMYEKFKQPVILPVSRLPHEITTAFNRVKKCDFGMVIKPGHFEFHPTGTMIPSPLVLAYTLSIAASGGVSKVLLAGFDGYETGDRRNEEVDNFLEQYQSTDRTPPVVSVTPTRYRVFSTSIYAY